MRGSVRIRWSYERDWCVNRRISKWHSGTRRGVVLLEGMSCSYMPSLCDWCVDQRLIAMPDRSFLVAVGHTRGCRVLDGVVRAARGGVACSKGCRARICHHCDCCADRPFVQRLIAMPDRRIFSWQSGTRGGVVLLEGVSCSYMPSLCDRCVELFLSSVFLRGALLSCMMYSDLAQTDT